MFLFQDSFRAATRTIRGVRYIVCSHYGGKDLIFDKIGFLLEDAIQRDAVCKREEKVEPPVALQRE